MVEVLENITKESSFASISKRNEYSERREYSGSVSNDRNYSTFSEMYLEKPIEVQAGFSVTICTWRGIPTVDDW